MEQQQADALELIAEAALRHELDPGAPGERYQVVVHVDAEVLEDVEATGPIRRRGRRTRSSWNVSAPGVRREPGGHAHVVERARVGDPRCTEPVAAPPWLPEALTGHALAIQDALEQPARLWAS